MVWVELSFYSLVRGREDERGFVAFLGRVRVVLYALWHIHSMYGVRYVQRR